MDLPDTTQFPVLTWTGHVLSLISIGGAFVGVLPFVASIFALVWYSLEIYENKTVQAYLSRRRARRVLKLKSKLAALDIKSNPEG